MNFKFFIVASALIGLMASCSSDDFSQDNEKAGEENRGYESDFFCFCRDKYANINGL